MRLEEIRHSSRLPDRFWSKVNKNGPLIIETPCWVWTANCFTRSHYGSFAIYLPGKKNPKMMGAHRMSWILEHGEVPDDLDVCHRCDNRPCVRPDHLFLGTNADNIKDAVAKGRVIVPTFVAYGSDATQARLSPEQVAEIVRLYDNGKGGYTHRSLGAHFNVSHRAIGQILRGQTYTRESVVA